MLLTTAAAGQNSSNPLPNPATPDLATIVQNMQQAQSAGRDTARPYIVTRAYQYYQGDTTGQPDSEVTAEISYLPPGKKEFTIRESHGSGRGERVVKKVLEHEQQMAGDWRQAALSDENYKFTYLGEETLDGRRCFILGLEPRREAKELLKGRAWVDAENYRVRRLVGEPAKSPSWWIKRLEVTLLFGNVQGMWLQTVSHADAEVRMFGHNVLNARDVSFRAGEVTAARRKPRRPDQAVGTGLLIVR